MIDFLNDVGNVEPRDMLTMLEIDGSSKWRCSFKSHVGMGSRQQDLDGDDRMMVSTCRIQTTHFLCHRVDVEKQHHFLSG